MLKALGYMLQFATAVQPAVAVAESSKAASSCSTICDATCDAMQTLAAETQARAGEAAPRAKDSVSKQKGEFKYDLSTALGYSMLFYEAQRSGPLAEDNRLDWKGDSPGCQGGACAPNDAPYEGGWYDAGDFVKFVYPMTYSAARLGAALWRFRGGLEAAQHDGQTHAFWIGRELRFVTDFLMRGHPEPRKLLAQVGDGDIDHAYMGRAEHMDVARPVAWIDEAKPGHDLAASYASAFAACALAFRETDAAYAQKCLDHAKSIMEWIVADDASLVAGTTYAHSVPGAKPFYVSTGIAHAVAYAASLMLHATGDANYGDLAICNLKRADDGAAGDNHKKWSVWSGWDQSYHDAVAVLAHAGVREDETTAMLKACLDAWIEGTGEVTATPGGGRWITQWGSLRYQMNSAALAMMARAAFPEDEARLACYAETMVNHVLGDTGTSFMVGFGDNYPRKPHHRGAACTLEESDDGKCAALWGDARDSPITLVGALVGGPKDPDDKYVDDRNDYVMSEVATDYNAGLTAALAGLLDRGSCLGGVEATVEAPAEPISEPAPAAKPEVSPAQTEEEILVEELSHEPCVDQIPQADATGCQLDWLQCGGIGYDGVTRCCSGNCRIDNDWWHMCVP